MIDERRGRAMGTTVHVIAVDAPAGATDGALRRIDRLERRWSRFLSDSEVSAMNTRPEEWHLVSTDTVRLVETAIAASRLTAGAYDPTVAAAVRANGYDRPFDQLADTDARRVVSDGSTPGPSPGVDHISVDRTTGLVRLGAATGSTPVPSARVWLPTWSSPA